MGKTTRKPRAPLLESADPSGNRITNTTSKTYRAPTDRMRVSNQTGWVDSPRATMMNVPIDVTDTSQQRYPIVEEQP